MESETYYFSSFVETYGTHITALFSALLIAIIAPIAGLRAYFHQKEYELVRKRYLEDCLDRISSQIETSLSIFRHNWERSLTALKQFRSQKIDMQKELYQAGFLPLPPSVFETSRYYVLNKLVGDKIFFDVHQLLFAFVSKAINFFKHDLCFAMKLSIEGGEDIKLTASREEIFGEYLKEIDKFMEESKHYYILLSEIQKLSDLLEKERFTFKSIEKFHTKPTVKKSIANLKQSFREEFKKIE